MVQLAPKQHAEIERVEEPVPVFDPATGKSYRLVPADTYTRLAQFLDDRGENRQWLSLCERVLVRDGSADEPDIYGDLDPRKKQL